MGERQVREMMGRAVGCNLTHVDPDALLVRDLALDDLQLLAMLRALHEVSPSFQWPDQFDLDDARLGDVLYFAGSKETYQ